MFNRDPLERGVGDSVRAWRRKAEDETRKGERPGLGQSLGKEDSWPGLEYTAAGSSHGTGGFGTLRIPGFFSETTPRICPSNAARFVHQQFSYSQRNNGYIYLVSSNLDTFIT
jgi:hypothetical protein